MATHHTLASQSSTVGHLTVTTQSCLREITRGEALEAEMATGLAERSNKNNNVHMTLLIMFQSQEEINGKLGEDA